MSTPRRTVILGAAGRDFHNFNCLFRDDAPTRSSPSPRRRSRTSPSAATRPSSPARSTRRHPDPPRGRARVARPRASRSTRSGSPTPTCRTPTSWTSPAGSSPGGAHFCLASRTADHAPLAPTGDRRHRRAHRRRQVADHPLSQRSCALPASASSSIRHPMPYGDLAAQAVQRFATYDDLDRHRCTIEEREEYEPHIDNGFVVYAGVDYGSILEQAEAEADVILWDGGNNDTPFYDPTCTSPCSTRSAPGPRARLLPRRDQLPDGRRPGGQQDRLGAPGGHRARLESCPLHAQPARRRLQCRSAPAHHRAPRAAVRGRRVVVVEDGPTLTHGGMSYGAGLLAAHPRGGRRDRRPRPLGPSARSSKPTRSTPTPAASSPRWATATAQSHDLEETLAPIPVDAIVAGTPIDLTRAITVSTPVIRARYELREQEPGLLEAPCASWATLAAPGTAPRCLRPAVGSPAAWLRGHLCLTSAGQRPNRSQTAGSRGRRCSQGWRARDGQDAGVCRGPPR